MIKKKPQQRARRRKKTVEKSAIVLENKDVENYLNALPAYVMQSGDLVVIRNSGKEINIHCSADLRQVKNAVRQVFPNL